MKKSVYDAMRLNEKVLYCSKIYTFTGVTHIDVTGIVYYELESPNEIPIYLPQREMVISIARPEYRETCVRTVDIDKSFIYGNKVFTVIMKNAVGDVRALSVDEDKIYSFLADDKVLVGCR